MKKPKSSLTSFLRISVGGIVFLGLITSSTISGEGAAYETTPLSKDFFEGTSPKSDRSARDMSRDKMKKIKEVPEMEATTPSDLKRMTRRQALKEMDPEGPCQRFVLDVPLRNEFEFYSPGYGPDQPYPNRTDCIKTIEAPPGHLLRLDFRDEFHLEQSEQCRFDSLEIRDGAHGYSNLVGTFCGNKHPPPITSSDRYLWLRFTSDENIQYSGFHAVYWYIPRPTSSDQHPELDRCEFLINGSDGFANRSDIDENRTRLAVTYGLPLDCMWIITVQEGWKIMLQFVDFKLVKPNDCDSNFVDVFSDRTDLPSRLKNFCGSIADSVTSKSNVLHLRFFAEARSVNSTFSTLFTAFREKKKDESCTAEEYDCEDATCISIDLKCNQRINCRFRWDEDECQPKIGVFASVLESEHIIIILVVFCLILSGMCFAFLFNCTRKLVRDHRIIQEHIRQSRENEVDGVGRKERRSTFQATLQKITTLSTHGRSRSGSSSGGGSLQREVVKNGIKRDMTGDRSVSPAKKHFPETGECYVPVDDVIPILDRGGEEGGGGGGDEGGDAGDQEPEEFFPAPETKDSECQTRESLFSSRPADFDGESDGSPTPPPPPPPPPSAVRIPTAENGRRGKPRMKNDFVSEKPPFSTFGYGRDRLGGYGDEKRYRAEAVIEMDDRKGEKRDSSANPDPYDVRPFSVDSTKSAPDVIVTH